MANEYLEKQINKYESRKEVFIFLSIFCSFVLGRYFVFSGQKLLLNLVTGFIMGILGLIVLYFIEKFIFEQASYKKGLKLEERIEEILKQLHERGQIISYQQHVETDYGDLDFYVKKDSFNYGIEAKNYAGPVTFDNGLLKISGYDNTDILHTLLKHCLLARNKIFGEKSDEFIRPVLIFGERNDVHIPQNRIAFNNIEIVVATVKDLRNIFNK